MQIPGRETGEPSGSPGAGAVVDLVMAPGGFPPLCRLCGRGPGVEVVSFAFRSVPGWGFRLRLNETERNETQAPTPGPRPHSRHRGGRPRPPKSVSTRGLLGMRKYPAYPTLPVAPSAGADD